MRLITFIIAIVFLYGCNSPETSESNYLIGKWKAQWETDPAGYPETDNLAVFKMNGEWVFNEDHTMSIAAYGFESCIFGEDTLFNKQKWKLSNDTIYLVNDQNIIGLTCGVLNKSENSIRLQLLEDIFVNLEK